MLLAQCHTHSAAGNCLLELLEITFGLVRVSLGKFYDRRVEPDRGAKTISSETTFETDIRDFASLEKILWRLCEKTSSRLKSSELAGSTVTLKLKTSDFRQRTRST